MPQTLEPVVVWTENSHWSYPRILPSSSCGFKSHGDGTDYFVPFQRFDAFRTFSSKTSLATLYTSSCGFAMLSRNFGCKLFESGMNIIYIYIIYVFAGCVRAWIASLLCKVLFIQSVGKRACFGDASVDKPTVESSHSVAWLFTGWFCKFWLRDDSNNVKKCNLVPINYVQLLTFEPIQLNVWL